MPMLIQDKMKAGKNSLFLNVFDINGYDPVDQTINGKAIAELDENHANAVLDYLQEISVQAASLVFGAFTTFRNDAYHLEDVKPETDESNEGELVEIKQVRKRELLSRTIFKNIFLLPDGFWERMSARKPGALDALWLIFTVIPVIPAVRFTYAALMIMVTPVKNIIKSVVELMPLSARRGIENLIALINKRSDVLKLAVKDIKNQTLFLMILHTLERGFYYWAAKPFLRFVNIPFTAIHFVGRAIMSPLKGAKAAFYEYNESIVAALASGFISFAAYILLPPLTAKGISFAAPYVAGFFQKTLPALLKPTTDWIVDVAVKTGELLNKRAPWLVTAWDKTVEFITQTVPAYWATHTPTWVSDTAKTVSDAVIAAYDYVSYGVGVAYGFAKANIIAGYAYISGFVEKMASFITGPITSATGIELDNTLAGVTGTIGTSGMLISGMADSVSDTIRVRGAKPVVELEPKIDLKPAYKNARQQYVMAAQAATEAAQVAAEAAQKAQKAQEAAVAEATQKAQEEVAARDAKRVSLMAIKANPDRQRSNSHSSSSSPILLFARHDVPTPEQLKKDQDQLTKSISKLGKSNGAQ